MATAIDWPSGLPQAFEAQSYQYAPGSGVVRTNMSAGPPKVRRRFTAVYDMHSGSMIMTKTLFTTTFLTFFGTTIAGGSLSFNFPNQFDDGVTTFEARFSFNETSAPYTVQQYTPEYVKLSFSLEEIG